MYQGFAFYKCSSNSYNLIMVTMRGYKCAPYSLQCVTYLLVSSIIVLGVSNCLAKLAAESGQSQTHTHAGYILYCPCMGRFGNQAEQLLGSLLFAKSVNRTLVLPPFIHYALNHLPELIPFDRIIQVEPIKKYHHVIPLQDFMRKKAPSEWPQGARKFYCYSERDPKSEQLACDPLRGQPFNTFWSAINVEEDSSVFYKPLMTGHRYADDWNKRFPPSSDPVLTFVGAPSSFPTHRDSISIQKYIKLSKFVEQKAVEFKRTHKFLDKPYLSIHIRHGTDWKKACEILHHNEGLTQLFSSNQCTGYGPRANQKLQSETCLPSFESIVQKLNEGLNMFRTKRNIDIQIVHIATDSEDESLWQKLRSLHPDINFVISPPAEAEHMLSTMIDIYLMSYSDVFIGNCISSFSAFPARIRSEQLNLDHMTLYFGPTFSKVIEKSSFNDEL